MLTIRLRQNGILCAFQTNKVATLLQRADEDYKDIMHLISDIDRPGTTLFVSGEPTVIDERTEQAEPPLAALRLTTAIDRGISSYLDDARIICLYRGDYLHVIDCGAALFEWHEG